MNIGFTKMCGAGNDFLITDSSRMTCDLQKLISEIPKLCHRKFGIGADGVCILIPKEKSLEWHFFNSDGSKASMCGNAACCLIHYAYDKKLQEKSKPVILKISDKTIEGMLDQEGKAQVKCDIPQYVNKNQSIQFENESINFQIVNSGVDHIVIEHPSTSTPNPLKPLAKDLRKKHPSCNITFYKKESANKITCITFERGVEDFTLACGTGALATSFVQGLMPFDIHMPGGVLNVKFDKQNAFLSSPVNLIAEITPKN